MAAKIPKTVKAMAICMGVCVNATTMEDAPMPKKKTTIMGRLPHKSPKRPAGIEPKPNIKNAPAV